MAGNLIYLYIPNVGRIIRRKRYIVRQIVSKQYGGGGFDSCHPLLYFQPDGLYWTMFRS